MICGNCAPHGYSARNIGSESLPSILVSSYWVLPAVPALEGSKFAMAWLDRRRVVVDESLNPARVPDQGLNYYKMDLVAEYEMELTVEKADYDDYDAQYETGNVVMRPMLCEWKDNFLQIYIYIYIFIYLLLLVQYTLKTYVRSRLILCTIITLEPARRMGGQNIRTISRRKLDVMRTQDTSMMKRKSQRNKQWKSCDACVMMQY